MCATVNWHSFISLPFPQFSTKSTDNLIEFGFIFLFCTNTHVKRTKFDKKISDTHFWVKTIDNENKTCQNSRQYPQTQYPSKSVKILYKQMIAGIMQRNSTQVDSCSHRSISKRKLSEWRKTFCIRSTILTV